MTDGESLLNTITSEPDGNVAALVLADWLQEHNAGQLASLLRDAVQLRSDQAKVWVCTSGEYSDYRIEAVYSSKSLADEYYAANGGLESGANEPNEFVLNKEMSIIEQYRRGYLYYMVEMLIDGSVRNVVVLKVWKERFDPFYEPYSRPYQVGGFCCYCFATSREHAVKICNDKRIQYLATNGVERPKT